ncbi:endolytic transglycosylase MltG [Aquisalimonas lutea]|uniref:endolytic transglycosylase MltG n=1 Tax=Aquisalimonas lutea TaxID=1327750 RepID=UPI0025B2ED34|nr:endolytic transglycosylase MltG [Aquisalimonas lutea]MDN3518477.1 endolytic transglycosylase MltG [Aquisalimonas lutea]
MTGRRLLVRGLLVAAVVVLLAAAALAVDYQRWSTSALHTRDAPYTLTLESGQTVRAVTDQLDDHGILDRPLYLRLHARLSGKAPRLQSGEYRIPAGMTAPGLLSRIVKGDVIQYRFTIIEGWTFRQLRAALEADPRIVNALDGMSGDQVMAELGRPDEHPEGWFYPETYHYTRGTTDREILARAHEKMRQHLESVWADRKEDLPLASAYEALILASIIERETGAPEERREIAGVFIRRLEQGMRLQTDPTVIYGMGDEYEGRIRTSDLREDTPYNTYTRSGLPPTPIAMPGGASLEAAVNPAPGDAMYFVSRGDGTHVFSETLEEHNQAVQRYILDGED